MKEQAILFLTLVSLGTIMWIISRVSGDIGIWLMRTFHFGWANNPMYRFFSMNGKEMFRLNNRGEGETGTTSAEIKFSPEQQKAVDHIIETRLARERAAKADYDDLRKFKEESLKQQDAKAQKELEEQKQYEEAKKAYEAQVNQHKEIISKKDYEITDLKIGHTLTNEISRQNGFIEETIALLKQSAALIEGNVFIKTKDANGIDIQLPASEGVKRFLESRPHLVKSNFKAGGGGSGSTNTGNVGSEGTETLSELNQKLADAMARGDNKEMNELNRKIRAKLTTQNVKI